MNINGIACTTTPEKWVIELKKAFVDQAINSAHSYLYLNRMGEISTFSTLEEAARQEYAYKLTSKDIAKLMQTFFSKVANTETEFSVDDLFTFKRVYKIIHSSLSKQSGFQYLKTLIFSNFPTEIQEEYIRIKEQLNIKAHNELVVLNQHFYQQLHDFYITAANNFNNEILCQETFKKFKENWLITYNKKPKNGEEWKSHIEELNKKINAIYSKIQAANLFGGLNNSIDCEQAPSLRKQLDLIKESVFSSLDHDDGKLKKDILKLPKKIECESSEVDLSEELKFFNLNTPTNMDQSSVISPDSFMGSIGSIDSISPHTPSQLPQNLSPIPTPLFSSHRISRKYENFSLTPLFSKINNNNNNYIKTPTRQNINEENRNNFPLTPLHAKANNNNNTNIKTPISKNITVEELNDSPFKPQKSKIENLSNQSG